MSHLLRHLVHVFLGDQVLKLGKALASYPVCGLGMRLGRYGNETTGMWPRYEARKVRE